MQKERRGDPWWRLFTWIYKQERRGDIWWRLLRSTSMSFIAIPDNLVKLTWGNMETVDQLLQGMPCLIMRCDLSTSTQFSLFAAWTIFRPYMYVTTVRRWRQRHRKTRFGSRFRFGSRLPYVSQYVSPENRVVLAFFTSFKWKTSNSFPTILIFSDFTIRIVNC